MQLPDTAAAEEIRQLKARYFRYVDTKQWKKLRSVFTADCVFEGLWSAADSPDVFVANVSANLSDDVVSVHQGFSPELQLVGTGVVRGIWTMTDYLTWPPGNRRYLGVSLPGQHGIRGYGYYEDEYRHSATEWRISFSRLTRLRIDPLLADTPTVDYPFMKPDPRWLA